MLQMLLKYFFKKQQRKSKPTFAEEIIYKREVYPLYLQIQNNFRYCMQNRLLKRKDILEFKEMLNKCVELKDYRFEKFENDAHEIYTKLKSTSITKKEMLMLQDFIQPYIVVVTPTKVYGNLKVVK